MEVLRKLILVVLLTKQISSHKDGQDAQEILPVDSENDLTKAKANRQGEEKIPEFIETSSTTTSVADNKSTKGPSLLQRTCGTNVQLDINTYEQVCRPGMKNFKSNETIRLAGVTLFNQVINFPQSRTLKVRNLLDSLNEDDDFITVTPVDNKSLIRVIIAKWHNTKMKFANFQKDFEKYDEKKVADRSVFSINYLSVRNSTFISLPVSYGKDITKDIRSLVEVKRPHTIKSVKKECVWLDLNHSTWNTSGCNAETKNESFVNCSCSHTTTFAVLLLVEGRKEVYPIINTISTVCEILTVVCLVFTIMFIITARQGSGLDSGSSPSVTTSGLRVNRTVNQINISISLLGLHTATLMSEIALGNDKYCVTNAFFTHFFLIANILWCLNEGVTLVLKLKIDFQSYRKLTVLQTVIAWSASLICALLTVALTFPNKKYMDKNYLPDVTQTDNNSMEFQRKYYKCWLSEELTLWGATIPVSIITFINICIASYVASNVFKITKNSNIFLVTKNLKTKNNNDVKVYQDIRCVVSSLKAFSILFIVLGLPWIFLLMANITEAKLVFLSINAVVNSSQGVFLGLLYYYGEGGADRKKFKRRIFQICGVRNVPKIKFFTDKNRTSSFPLYPMNNGYSSNSARAMSNATVMTTLERPKN